MKNNDISRIVREEIERLVTEAKKNSPKIAEGLEELRVKFFPEMLEKEDTGIVNAGRPRLEKRVQITTVAELLEVPVNDLMLYFLNEVKTKNGRSLVEYHMGQVYFYAC